MKTLKLNQRLGLFASFYESTGQRAKSIAQAARYFGLSPRRFYL